MPTELKRAGRYSMLFRIITTVAAVLLIAGSGYAGEPTDTSGINAAPPKWELGVGVVGFRQPYYPGADEGQALILPFPYLIYRGSRLRANRGGIRGRLFNSDRAELDISIRGTLPVNSQDSEAREGLPDLDFTVEAGPQFAIRLLRSEHFVLWGRLPVRALLSTDFSSIKYQGVTTAPNLRLYYLPDSKWAYSATISAIFSNADYHNYFWGIPNNPAFIRPDRPAFDADGGYTGSSLTLTGSTGFGKWGVTLFANYLYLGGAAFADSPLIKQDSALYFGLIVTRILLQSKARSRAETAPADSPVDLEAAQ